VARIDEDFERIEDPLHPRSSRSWTTRTLKDERMPVLVIDGRDVSWEELGRMLMTFEGWQFRIEIRDRSEEV
jgi:hypothetical protein